MFLGLKYIIEIHILIENGLFYIFEVIYNLSLAKECSEVDVNNIVACLR